MHAIFQHIPTTSANSSSFQTFQWSAAGLLQGQHAVVQPLSRPWSQRGHGRCGPQTELQISRSQLHPLGWDLSSRSEACKLLREPGSARKLY